MSDVGLMFKFMYAYWPETNIGSFVVWAEKVF